MSVYVDRLPESCYDCCCNNDDYNCRLTDSILPDKWDVRNDDCPLKVLVQCKDCKYQHKLGGRSGWCDRAVVDADDYVKGIVNANDDDYCSYGEIAEQDEPPEDKEDKE